jgi:integrase
MRSAFATASHFSIPKIDRGAGRVTLPFIGLRFHDLRHTAITKLAEGEASDQTIMSIAGHLDPKMLEHYSHVRERAKRRAVESISSYHPEENRSVPVVMRVQ